MDQTKRGRACEQELARLMELLEAMPAVGEAREAEEAIHLLFPDERECAYELASILTDPVDEPPSIVSRCVVALSSLCLEGEQLIDSAVNSILPPLLLYADYDSEGHPSRDFPALRLMASFMPFLLDVSMFLGRVTQVARSLLMQMHAFHSLDEWCVPGASDRALPRCWRTLGDLLAVLVQVDEVITSRPLIKQDWTAYSKAVETACHNPGQFETSEARLRPLLAALSTVQAQIIAANSFRNCYQQNFGELDEDAKFAERMRTTIMQMFGQWERAAATDVPDRRRLTALVALTTFYQLHFASKDKKLLKTVWSSHKKIVVFHLVGDLLWVPCSFLFREIPSIAEFVDKKSMEFIKATTDSLFEQQAENLIDEAASLVTPSQEWAAGFRLDMWKTRTRDAAESLRQADAILKGARLADSMSRLLKTVLNCKTEGTELPFSRSMLRKLFAVIQAIKLIALTFSEHWPSVVEVCQMACQQWRCHMLSVLEQSRHQLRAECDGKAAASLLSLDAAASALLSSASRPRLVVAAVALDMASHKKLRGGDWNQLWSLLSRLETLCRPRRLIARVTDCSFLLFHRHLFRLFASSLLQDLPSFQEIQCILLAAEDCSSLSARSANLIPHSFTQDIVRVLREDFLGPLCGEIENDLRVLSHPHLKVDDRDKTSIEKYEFFYRILRAPPLRIFDRMLSVKEFVEDYLEKTFYNLSAVSLHDCSTYTKMAMLAEFRYGLELTDGQLPYHTLNQGLDVVVVMRSLANFVSAYNYDFYHQFFIEKRSSSRSLQLLSWEHMANSLRTHGMGVVNTSVNIAYQLLRKKLAVISQFMDDEHVRALLHEESRHFDEHRKLKKMYPVKRAENVIRVMVDLGQLEGGETYFDRFRHTITQLGNALGFVRSMKSAAELVSSDTLVYDCADEEWLENGEDNQSLENEEENEDTRAATEMLRRIMRENREQDARNRQYIEKLVSFFSSSFRGDPSRFGHLSALVMLSPALCLSYVEEMLERREKTQRRGAGGGNTGSAPSTAPPPGHPPPTRAASTAHHTKELTFVDDGFVLGLAYLLTVIDGWEAFSALNWFRSVLEKVAEGRNKLTDTSKAAIPKTVALRLTQLAAYEKEFKLLSCTLQSSRMLFALEDEEEEEETADEENTPHPT